MAFLPNEEDDFFPVILGQRDIAVKTATAHFEDYGLLSTIRQKRISLQSIADEKLVLKCLKNLIHLPVIEVQTKFLHALFIDPDRI